MQAQRCYSDHPELQAKIRTAMIEGKIADEDFNGDPEYNVLGQTGIRGRETKKKAEPEDEDGEEQVRVSSFNSACNQVLISSEWW